VSPVRALGAIVLVAGIILGGCVVREDETLADRSFLTGTPCSPPCWYDLEVDWSTAAEVSEALQHLPFIDNSTIREWGTVRWDGQEGIEIVFGCRQPKMDLCGSVILSYGILRSVQMSIGYDLSFDQAVHQLGDPAFMAYIPSPGEAVACDVSLYWPEAGIAVTSRSGQPCATILETSGGVRPRADSRVHEITYGLLQETWPDVSEGGPYLRWPGFDEP
jgi:hypothetical protein